MAQAGHSGLFRIHKAWHAPVDPFIRHRPVGLVLGAIRGPLPVRLAALVCAIAIYFNSAIPNWWVGCSFGDRRIVDYSALFALGLGQLLAVRRSLATSPVTHALGLVLCAFTWILMIRYFTHRLPEYGDVSFHDLIVETIRFPVRLLGDRRGSAISRSDGHGSGWNDVVPLVSARSGAESSPS